MLPGCSVHSVETKANNGSNVCEPHWPSRWTLSWQKLFHIYEPDAIPHPLLDTLFSPGHAVWTGLYQSALACCSAYSFLPQHQRRSAMHSQRCTRCTSSAWVHRDSSHLPCHLSRVCTNLSQSCFVFCFCFLNPVCLSRWLLCCGLTWWWLKFFEIRAARSGSILSWWSNPFLSFSRKPPKAVLLPSALAWFKPV